VIRGVVRGTVDYGGLAMFVIAFFLHLKFVRSAGVIGWRLSASLHGKGDLVDATWWLVGASALALLIGLAVERRIAPMPLIGGVFALIFGVLTLLFQAPWIIKLKPTVVYLLFAGGLAGGLAMGKNPLKMVLGEALAMPDDAWRKLSVRYALFFLGMAILNGLAWAALDDKGWLLFHGPGWLILMVLFSATQIPFMMKYLDSPEPPPPPTE
jgi:intracellular septation protein